jgi:hypothetical protein
LNYAEWLPESAQVQLAIEAAQDRAEDKRQRAEAEARRAAFDEKNEAAYKQHAAIRYGEHVTAIDMIAGAGKTLDEILDHARGNLARDYAPEKPADERFYGEPAVGASRSAWPGTDYEAGRQIRRAEENREWIAAYRVRHRGAGAVEAARADRDRRIARRSVPMIEQDGYGREIYR